MVLRPVVLCLLVTALLLAPSVATADEGGVLQQARVATALGARSLQRGDLAAAVVAFERALELVPASLPAKKNLALALSRRAETALREERAEEALDLIVRALELHPRRIRYEIVRGRALLLLGRSGDALRIAESGTAARPSYRAAQELLGDAHERLGNQAEALAAFERAARLAPQDLRLRERVADLARRVETEGDFLAHATGNFRVRYGADADPETVRLALTLLEDAYSHVTADLGVTPRTPAKVVLYTSGEFQHVTQAHAWIGALYSKGSLRVPLRNLQRHREIASRVLTHEFTHHVLREAAPTLPAWWHEGIAQYVEPSTTSSRRRLAQDAEMLRRLRDAGRLLTLAQLRETAIARVEDAQVVRVYYAQALSFVAWLVNRFGTGALPSFLVALGETRDTDKAAAKVFGAGEAELFRQWRESL